MQLGGSHQGSSSKLKWVQREMSKPDVPYGIKRYTCTHTYICRKQKMFYKKKIKNQKFGRIACCGFVLVYHSCQNIATNTDKVRWLLLKIRVNITCQLHFAAVYKLCGLKISSFKYLNLYSHFPSNWSPHKKDLVTTAAQGRYRILEETV